MINSIIDSFSRLLKQPTLVIPGLFLVIFQVILMTVFFLLNDTIPRFFYEMFVLNSFPTASLLKTIFLLITSNLTEFLFLGVFILLWFAANLWLIFSYTYLLTKNEAPLKSAFAPLKHLGKIFGLAAFFGVLLLLFSIAMIFFTWLLTLGGIFGLIGFIAIFLWILIGAYLYFKLLFLPIEFFSKEQHINYAVKKVWKWSEQKFFSKVFFVILALIASNIFITAGLLISDFIPIEPIAILIIMIAMAFNFSFFAFALVNYYFSHN